MTKWSSKGKKIPVQSPIKKIDQANKIYNISDLKVLPSTYQEINDHFSKYREAHTFLLRQKAFEVIEKIRGRPLICYATKTYNLPKFPAASGITTAIDNSDVDAFADLVRTTDGDEVDVFIISNGGSAEATERIVNCLRNKFKRISFIVPGCAYSAATLMCLAGDEIIIDDIGTLGPIDPQINGIPARAILRGIEEIEKRLKEEGPSALSAYLPMIAKYDLHILEICKSAQKLSERLATQWLSKYMLKCGETSQGVVNVVKFLTNYDEHHSHARTISREEADANGIKVLKLEAIHDLEIPVRSLYNQYNFFFDKTGFYKMYENNRGINWGRQFVLNPQQIKP